MSSMIPMPPRQIPVGPGGPGPGGPGGPLAALGGAAGPGGPGGPGGAPPSAIGSGNDPDAQNVTELLRKAADLLGQAATAEKDDIDAAAIHKLAVGVHQQIAAEQKLNDDVMGAGPGAKMIRKTAPPAGGSGGSGGGY